MACANWNTGWFFFKQVLHRLEGHESVSLWYGGTHRQCKNLLQLDWGQSKVVMAINEYLPKFINRPRGTGIVILGHGVEEGTI